MPKHSKAATTQQALLKKALAAMKNAHVIWGFRVGAAVLAEDNKIYEGCNIETLIAGLGVCAERCAIDHAVLHGNRSIKEIAVVIEKENAAEAKPCGACLQYIHDFSKGIATVVTASVADGRVIAESVRAVKIGELLPSPFKSSKT